MTAKDIKGTNRLKFLVPDRPILCDAKVRYIGDPVAAVLAETREQAMAAAQAVRVEYEPLPVMMTPRRGPCGRGALQIDPDRPNLCYTQPQIRGDAEAALAPSDVVVEADFSTQINHQAALEPEACVAYLEAGMKATDPPILVVIGRSINIHFIWACFRTPSGTRTSVTKRPIPEGSSASSSISPQKDWRRQRRFTSNGPSAIFPA